MNSRRKPAAYGPEALKNIKANLLDPNFHWTKGQLMEVARTLVTTVERERLNSASMKQSLKDADEEIVRLEERTSRLEDEIHQYQSRGSDVF